MIDTVNPVAPIGVSPRKTATMLDCGVVRVYKLLNEGKLESYLDGRNRKILVSSINAYVASRPRHSGGRLGAKAGSQSSPPAAA
jgi:hypothetical protein